MKDLTDGRMDVGLWTGKQTGELLDGQAGRRTDSSGMKGITDVWIDGRLTLNERTGELLDERA